MPAHGIKETKHAYIIFISSLGRLLLSSLRISVDNNKMDFTK